jgi:hypothetical protein
LEPTYPAEPPPPPTATAEILVTPVGTVQEVIPTVVKTASPATVLKIVNVKSVYADVSTVSVARMVTVFVVPADSVLVPEMVLPESVSPPGRLPLTRE